LEGEKIMNNNFVISMVLVFLCSMVIMPAAVSAEDHPPYIEICDYTHGHWYKFGYNPKVDEITVHTSEKFYFSAAVYGWGDETYDTDHFAGYISGNFRHINYNLTNSTGDLIKKGRKLSGSTLFKNGYATFKVGKLPVGEYNLKVWYEGNNGSFFSYKVRPCQKTIPVHIIP
jgi:hypothetical protein